MQIFGVAFILYICIECPYSPSLNASVPVFCIPRISPVLTCLIIRIRGPVYPVFTGILCSDGAGPVCFICNWAGHITIDSVKQYCQRCGEFRHGMRRCNRTWSDGYHSGPIRSVVAESDNKNVVSEDSVRVNVRVEGLDSEALLDSFASSSVMDFTKLSSLRLKWKLVPGKFYAAFFCKHAAMLQSKPHGNPKGK